MSYIKLSVSDGTTVTFIISKETSTVESDFGKGGAPLKMGQRQFYYDYLPSVLAMFSKEGLTFTLEG